MRTEDMRLSAMGSGNLNISIGGGDELAGWALNGGTTGRLTVKASSWALKMESNGEDRGGAGEVLGSGDAGLGRGAARDGGDACVICELV
ncbi:hypothetical protein M0R45_005038 [Rubus argutus]|uniref:Uncharacterized protein n=1 Tax=Rubus argutus TaxID=59490 RepID=A0AAW1YLG3_RUBAR